jgi:hypothetical protein
VRFSKETERRECSAYASEDFDDPAECERLIQAFRDAHGRDAQSFVGGHRDPEELGANWLCSRRPR